MCESISMLALSAFISRLRKGKGNCTMEGSDEPVSERETEVYNALYGDLEVPLPNEREVWSDNLGAGTGRQKEQSGPSDGEGASEGEEEDSDDEGDFGLILGAKSGETDQKLPAQHHSEQGMEVEDQEQGGAQEDEGDEEEEDEEDDEEGFSIIMRHMGPSTSPNVAADLAGETQSRTQWEREGAKALPKQQGRANQPPVPPLKLEDGTWLTFNGQAPLARYDEDGRRLLPGGAGGSRFIPPDQYREFLQLGHGGILDLDLDNTDVAPWRAPGVDVTDYFNYGFNERTWKDFQASVRRERLKRFQTYQPTGAGEGAQRAPQADFPVHHIASHEGEQRREEAPQIRAMEDVILLAGGDESEQQAGSPHPGFGEGSSAKETHGEIPVCCEASSCFDSFVAPFVPTSHLRSRSLARSHSPHRSSFADAQVLHQRQIENQMHQLLNANPRQNLPPVQQQQVQQQQQQQRHSQPLPQTDSQQQSEESHESTSQEGKRANTQPQQEEPDDEIPPPPPPLPADKKVNSRGEVVVGDGRPSGQSEGEGRREGSSRSRRSRSREREGSRKRDSSEERSPPRSGREQERDERRREAKSRRSSRKRREEDGDKEGSDRERERSRGRDRSKGSRERQSRRNK